VNHCAARLRRVAARLSGEAGQGGPDPLSQGTCPVVPVRAPLGLSHEEQPPDPDPAEAAGRRLAPQRADVLVPGVNHYTIGLSGHGAGAVADVIRERPQTRQTSSPT
jgi:hypothetical protein